MAQRLKQQIQSQRQLTATIGVAANKLLAKIASDFRKPDGLTLIAESQKVSFLRPLPVRAPYGDLLGEEWDASEIAPGHLLGLLRNNHPQSDGYFWKTESLDGGRTWQIPRKTNVQSRRATSPPQICWHNQTPTLIFADRRMVSVSAAKTTDPAFLNWEPDWRLPCYYYNDDQSQILDGSYPVSVQTGPHERLIVDQWPSPDWLWRLPAGTKRNSNRLSSSRALSPRNSRNSIAPLCAAPLNCSRDIHLFRGLEELVPCVWLNAAAHRARRHWPD
ncbi:MAG TPA: hypothetical protein P5186_22115 [Candidatus Paceibacterota bacterium]|nr:hypothetical protein [Candidatus Paceibacterota bacterium]